MDIWEYYDELMLIDRQYGQEEDLYYIINRVIRETLPEYMTVRDIHNMALPSERVLRELPGRECFTAFGQVPDLVIVDKRFDQSREGQRQYIYGCVEIKKFKNDNSVERIVESLGSSLDTLRIQKRTKLIASKDSNVKKKVTETVIMKNNKPVTDKGEAEVLRELIHFKKMILTDGIRWYYLKIDRAYRKKSREKSMVKDIIKSVIGSDWLIKVEGFSVEKKCDLSGITDNFRAREKYHWKEFNNLYLKKVKWK
ncbi:hypothetical protein [Ruminococcus sp. NK3A76]|uniref:hypothetical protein n=1 Tax=Ruminococcus sp. NK3A76 TaxID=877411 RepID=UPI00048A88C6|nr:hypothetical protein [Ruminococcus sp. NK3A76]